MNSYRVTYEIDIEADSPLDAAKSADWFMQKENRTYAPFFRVKETAVDRTFDVDLEAGTCEDTWWE